MGRGRSLCLHTVPEPASTIGPKSQSRSAGSGGYTPHSEGHRAFDTPQAARTPLLVANRGSVCALRSGSTRPCGRPHRWCLRILPNYLSGTSGRWTAEASSSASARPSAKIGGLQGTLGHGQTVTRRPGGNFSIGPVALSAGQGLSPGLISIYHDPPGSRGSSRPGTERRRRTWHPVTGKSSAWSSSTAACSFSRVQRLPQTAIRPVRCFCRWLCRPAVSADPDLIALSQQSARMGALVRAVRQPLDRADAAGWMTWPQERRGGWVDCFRRPRRRWHGCRRQGQRTR